MVSEEKLDSNMKLDLRTEAAPTATKCDNVLSEIGQESPYWKFHGKDALYEKYLRTFGEMSIVTLAQEPQSN